MVRIGLDIEVGASSGERGLDFFFFFVFGWWKEGVDVLLCADGCGGLWCVVALGDGVGWDGVR